MPTTNVRKSDYFDCAEMFALIAVSVGAATLFSRGAAHAQVKTVESNAEVYTWDQSILDVTMRPVATHVCFLTLKRSATLPTSAETSSATENGCRSNRESSTVESGGSWTRTRSMVT